MSMDVNAADTDQLLKAAQQNNPNQIRDLVTLLGVPPSSGNGINQTALHVAAIWGHVESIQIFSFHDQKLYDVLKLDELSIFLSKLNTHVTLHPYG